MDPTTHLETRESLQFMLTSENASEYVNGTKHTSIKFYLNDPIKLKRGVTQITMSVISFQCPISYYLINETNQHLVIDDVSYTLLQGNYNANTFINAMLQLLPVGFGISLNNVTNQFTFTYTSEFTINASTTMYQVLGLVKNTEYTSSGNLLTLPYTCNFSGLNRFNILASNLSTRNIDSRTKSPSSIIATIPVNNAQNSVILYELKQSFEMMIKQAIIDHLVIEIKDDANNYLDLNNQHWQMCIQFNMYFDQEKLPSTFHQSLRK
jgi:hypothetical protein